MLVMAELRRVVMVDTVDLLKHMVVVLLRRTADMVCQQEGLTLEVDTTMQTQAEEVVTGATATLVAIVDVEVVEDIEKNDQWHSGIANEYPHQTIYTYMISLFPLLFQPQKML
jgi:hypothetical protein